MTVLAVAGAALGWVGVVFLPGLALCSTLRPTAGLARNAALAPLLGIGWTMVVAQLLDVTSVSVRTTTVLPASIGIPALTWLVVGRGRSNVTKEDDKPRRAYRGAAPVCVLLAGMIIGLGTWWTSIPGVLAGLPSTDGAHHALYAHRILELHAIEPKIILSGDLLTHTPTWNFYPLAIHLCAAMISGVTGVAVNTVLTTGMVLSAGVVLPIGMVVLTRRFLPGNELVAATAGALAANLAWFPFSPILWGGLPLIVAMCQVPAAVDAMRGVPRDGRPIPLGTLLGIAAYGLFEEHNSELVSAAIFGLILLGVDWRHFSAADRRRVAYAVGCATVVSAVLVAPSLQDLAGGIGERQAYLGYQFATRGLGPVGWVLGVTNPLFLVFALVGLTTAVRIPTMRGWLGCLGVSALIFLASLVHTAPTRTLTEPWYSNGGRISYLVAYFEVMLAAMSLVPALTATSKWLRRNGTVRPAVAIGVPVGLFTAMLIGLVSVESHAFIALAYRQGSDVSNDQRAGFAWLASHVPHNSRVLNEFVDDSGWMETLDGVHPVFATDPETLPLVNPQTQWGDRWYLLTHAAQLATDKRAQAAVRAWNVQYVYVNSRIIGPYQERLPPRRLAESSAYQVVWRQGAVWIFRVRVQSLP